MSPTARMPRDQRRTQLLETAIPLFTENGFHATSMDDIASAAGVTKPVLYQHFTSKEELYDEVVQITGQRLIEGVQSLAAFDGATMERVREGMRGFYQLVTAQAALRLFTGHEHVSDEVSERVTAVLDETAVRLASVLLAARHMTDAQARVIGRAMISLTQSTASMMHTAPEQEHEQILDTAAMLAVRGLTAFEPLTDPSVAGTVSPSDGASSVSTDG